MPADPRPRREPSPSHSSRGSSTRSATCGGSAREPRPWHRPCKASRTRSIAKHPGTPRKGERVTLRIVCRRLEKETVIELHGWLSGPEVAEFGRTCDKEAQSIRIDLENLSAVSADGILALPDQQ